MKKAIIHLLNKHFLRICSIISIVVLFAFLTLTIVGIFVDSQPIASISAILSNPYLSGIVCTICLIFIVFDSQIVISKKRINKDYRCNEVMEGIYDAIVDYRKMIIPTNKEDELKFVVDNRSSLSRIVGELSYFNNDLLLESIKMCFFLNLNFRLLGIMNNIINRLPNLRKGNKKVIEWLNYERKRRTFSEYDVSIFLIDLRFMVTYWKSLLDYLEYDDIYTRTLVSYYRKYFPDQKFDGVENVSIRMTMIEKTFGKAIKAEVKRIKKENKK